MILATAPLSREYVQTWLHGHDAGPWSCQYDRCNHQDHLIISLGGRTKLDGVIHHIDEDHENRDLTNLQIMHRRCHSQYHRTRYRTLVDKICALIECSKTFRPRCYTTKFYSRPCMYRSRSQSTRKDER